MTMNDRIALELGRALLRALIAEDRAQAAETRNQEFETQPANGAVVDREGALT